MFRVNRQSVGVIFGLTAVFVMASAASAASVWDEGVDGDISTDRLNPSSAALAPGSNTVTATSVGGNPADREYITLNVPAGYVMSAIVLDAYASLDDVAFIGIQAGTPFTEPPTGTNVANLLGYSHFGPGDVGTNMMPAIGAGAGAAGFVPPLPAGDYTFWMQQTGSNPATYTFDFVVTPEPASLALLAAGGLALLSRRRQPQ